jgi:hypothetical protein
VERVLVLAVRGASLGLGIPEREVSGSVGILAYRFMLCWFGCVVSR